MSELLHEKISTGDARIVAAPEALPQAKVRNQVEGDRNFELPTSLFAATVACYLGFLGIMLAAFAAPMLAIPMVIFALFIIAGFGVPALWTRMAGNYSKPMTFSKFSLDGIMTNTGPCASRDAIVQMLILPVLIVGWALVVAIIAAIVT